MTSARPPRSPRDVVRPTSESLLLHRPFELRADAAPEATALLHTGGAWSYGRLERRANRLARRLVAQGVGPEVPVAVFLERSPEAVLALLAVLKAGGAYLPIEVDAPPGRVVFELADAGARLVLTSADVAPRLPDASPPRLLVEAGGGAAGEDDERLPPRADPDHLAYLIYTSGSTGRPKAVAVTHDAAARHMEWMQRELPLTSRDVFALKTVLSFDASVTEVFAPLGAGSALLVVPPGAHREPAQLARSLVAGGATVLQVVPSLLRLLLDEPEMTRCTTLRRLLCGGEALPPALLARAARLLDVEIVNLYGPTETTIEVVWWRAAPGETADPVPIGRAIPGARIEVLDAELAPVPAGEVGELCVAGSPLARGYLRRPGLTAERFRPDPFGGAGGRLYRTGDLGRCDGDGLLYCLGRRDGQVKLHGRRLELGEVEAALERHPAVAAAAARVDDAAAGARLVAWIVAAAGGGPPSTDELRRHLERELPRAFVPSLFVPLAELPYTANGKLDRRALPAPPATAGEREGWEAPRGARERQVAAAISELLGGVAVGRDDDLFALGGHSLLAMRLLARLRRELGRELSLADLLAGPTPATLARRLDSAPPAIGAPLPEVRPRPRSGPPPASATQERVLFLESLAPEMRAYQFQNLLRLTGRVDVAALAAALTEICRRHEIYRTSFAPVEGGWVQVVQSPRPAALTLVDLVAELPAASPAERIGEAERRIGEELARRIDPSRLPLVRWMLYRHAADGWLLLHHEHHLIHDGWSFNRFLDELLATYRAVAAGEPPPLPDPAVQFADFAMLDREWQLGAAAGEQVEWWRRRLAGGAAAAALPYDRPRPAEPRFLGRTITREVPAEAADELRALARDSGATIFMAFLAGFFALLHRYSGERRLQIGSAVANRRWPGSDGLFGMLVNNLVLRADLDGRPSFRVLLEAMRGEVLEAWEHQEVAFERVVREVAPARGDGSRDPLFQVMFSFHDSPLPELALPGLDVELDEGIANGSAKFDMNVVAIPRREQRAGWRGGADRRDVTLIWEADRDLFDAATVDRAALHFRALLAAAAAEPDRPLDELPLLDAAERRQIEVEWAGPPPTPLPAMPVHRLVLERARATPAAPAVEGDGETWTYGELAERVGRLAQALLAAGAGPEVPVGIALPRGPEMVAAVLAVLAAGAAYLPLDPAFPRPRLAWMLEDSAASLVVTRHGVLAADLLAGRRVIEPTPELASGGGTASFAWPDLEIAPESLAYVLYTSGSTGRPKGVEVPHRALANLLAAMARRPGLDARDTLLAVTTLSFDIAALELLLPLVVGGRVVVASADEVADGALLAARLAACCATTMQATPATWRLLLDAGWPGDPRLVALCGGEALPGDLADRLAPRVRRLWNVYGPTETTVWSAARPVEPVESPILVGGVIDNTRLALVDGRGEPVPVGAIGEVALGGVGVARGYRRRPGLTAERFLPDPSGGPGARRYHTGDLARWRGDGLLELLGRSDGQVKVHGFRIELGEVEAALRRHPAVVDAVVAARPAAAGGQQLVAWTVTAGPPPEPAELRRHLAETLPGYMVPAAFLAIDELPRTPNGKIDRRALPDPEPATDGDEPVAPRNEIEELLVGVWRELIGSDRIGITDSFFDLGGHSLLATRQMHRLRTLLGIDLPVRTLYQAPTVAELAAVIEARLEAEA